MSKKIQTLHPEGKKGVNISAEKYEQVKAFILDMVSCQGPLSYKELNLLAEKHLAPVFNGSASWYVVTVKLDLEARKILKRVKLKSGHAVELA